MAVLMAMQLYCVMWAWGRDTTRVAAMPRSAQWVYTAFATGSGILGAWFAIGRLPLWTRSVLELTIWSVVSGVASAWTLWTLHLWAVFRRADEQL